MQNLPITQLLTAENKQAHSELVAALGTENNPAQWMDFMRAVKKHLPAILSKGRPSKDAISRSLIGAYGFESWKQMVEAPVEQSGLGWNWSAWRAWSRAWAVVVEHPFLENEPMTSSEVNTLYSQIKNLDIDWPTDKVELDSLFSEIEEKKEQQKQESIKSLKSEIIELNLLIETLDETVSRGNLEMAKLIGENKKLKSMTRWGHFKKALGLI